MTEETLLSADQEHRNVRHVEQQRLEVEVTPPRHHDLCRVTRKAERLAQSDELWMPHRKEGCGVERAGPYENGIGCISRQPFIEQMLVGVSATKCAWIGARGIAIPRLDKCQRQARPRFRSDNETEISAVVRSGPRITNSADARPLEPLKCGWESADVRRACLSDLLFREGAERRLLIVHHCAAAS